MKECFMPSVKTVERRISEIENVDVIFLQNATDVRSDKILPKQYPYKRGAKNSYTVKDLIDKRLKVEYTGFDFSVLDASGNAVPGQTKLETVRDTYNSEIDNDE